MPFGYWGGILMMSAFSSEPMQQSWPTCRIRSMRTWLANTSSFCTLSSWILILPVDPSISTRPALFTSLEMTLAATISSFIRMVNAPVACGFSRSWFKICSVTVVPMPFAFIYGSPCKDYQIMIGSWQIIQLNPYAMHLSMSVMIHRLSIPSQQPTPTGLIHGLLWAQIPADYGAYFFSVLRLRFIKITRVFRPIVLCIRVCIFLRESKIL